jgi:hypothetical protein
VCKLLVSTRLPALVCLAFAAFVLSAAGDEKPIAESPQPKPAKVVLKAVELFGGEQRIMKALDEWTDMDFVETPLRDVVQAISIRHSIPILLDVRAITDAGSNADTPITFQLRGTSLKSALRQMLHEHELDFAIHNDVLLITTADAPTTLRQYDVADLVRDGNSIESLAKAVMFALPRTEELVPQPGAASGAPAASESPPTSARVLAAAFLQRGPQGKLVPDGEVMPFQSVLLVRTTDRGHANVETFLAELRHHMNKHDLGEKASADK